METSYRGNSPLKPKETHTKVEGKSWDEIVNEVRILQAHIDELTRDLEEYFGKMQKQMSQSELPLVIQKKLMVLQFLHKKITDLRAEVKEERQEELEAAVQEEQKAAEQDEKEGTSVVDDDEDDDEVSEPLEEFYTTVTAYAEEYNKKRVHTEKIAGKVSVTFRWDAKAGGFSLFFTDPHFKETLIEHGIREASIPISPRFEDYDDIREYAHTIISNNPGIDPLSLFQQLSMYSRDRISAHADGKQMNKHIEIRSIPSPGTEQYKLYFTIDGIECGLRYNASTGSFELVFPDIKGANAITLYTENDADAKRYIEQLRTIIAQSGENRNMHTIFSQLQQYVQDHALLN